MPGGGRDGPRAADGLSHRPHGDTGPREHLGRRTALATLLVATLAAYQEQMPDDPAQVAVMGR